MRPIDRGDCPTGDDGRPLTFSDYALAKPHLLDRLGSFCSFCEVEISGPIDVEHIRHKDQNPDLECAWSNLLLACKNCNSTKGTKVNTAADVSDRLWPHLHRTFDVFEYGPAGRVALADMTDPELRARAAATAEMVGLMRRPQHGLTTRQLERATDRRYQKRSEAWREACDARADLRTLDSPEMRACIVRHARARGFWSVWITVFADDVEMRRALHVAFTGTAVDRVEAMAADDSACSADQPTSSAPASTACSGRSPSA